MGAISLVSVAIGVEIGATAKPSGVFPPVPTNTDTPSPTPTTPGPTPTDPSTTPTPTTPAPKPTPKPTPKPSPVTPISHQSAAIKYRFGTVQVTVTKTGTKITDVTMDRAGATNGRASSFPYLVSLTLQAQSSSFDTSMLSGATYSTDAYLQALDNALAQF